MGGEGGNPNMSRTPLNIVCFSSIVHGRGSVFCLFASFDGFSVLLLFLPFVDCCHI